MLGVIEGEEALTVRDGAVPNENEVEVFFPDGHSIVASGRPQVTFDWCEGHFIAHGVCVDCTRDTGRTVWAS